ncbi:unnamed protein product [Effrenium voratum]|nr:unnamed protein product [Effrenium voratum]
MASIVKTGDGPDDFYSLDFPCELNNTDYLRRILAHVTSAMRPAYEAAIETGLPREKDGLGYEMAPEHVDAYFALKHASANMGYYSQALSQPKEFLLDALQFANAARNTLAHEKRGGVDREFLKDSFGMAGRIAAATQVHFAQDNLACLEKMYEEHRRSKDARQKAREPMPAPHERARGRPEGLNSPSTERKRSKERSERGADGGPEAESKRVLAMPNYATQVQKLQELLAWYKAKDKVQTCSNLQLLIECLKDHADALYDLSASLSETRARYDDAFAKDQFKLAAQLDDKCKQDDGALQALQGYAERGYRHLRRSEQKGVEAALRTLLPELLDDGWTAEDLGPAGFTVDLVQWRPGAPGTRQAPANYYPKLKAAGFSAKALAEAGLGQTAITTTGFSVQELLAEGCATCRVAGVAAGQLKQAGVTAGELKDGGYQPLDLLEAGFSAQELKAIGLSAPMCRSARAAVPVRAGQLRQAGFSARELEDAGYVLHELWKVGYSVEELKAEGFTAPEFRTAGVQAQQLMQAGFSAMELKAAGYRPLDLLKAGFLAQELLAEFSAQELRAAGLQAAQLAQAGFSAAELREAGYRPRDLQAAGYSAQLKTAGFSAQECRAAKLQASYLRQAGFAARELKVAGYHPHELRQAGYTPHC